MVTRGIKEGTQTKSSVSNANAKFMVQGLGFK
jgi:hypothetical protein